MSSIRPLPAHPSITFDRKQAKALLAALRAGDPGALARASAHLARSAHQQPDDWSLADAQRIVAREYGLPSWPRLVAYLADLERQRHAPRHNRVDEPVEQLERRAQWVLRRHAQRDEYVAREMAQYLPQCYGQNFADIFTREITLDDARLVVARQHRHASWADLLENVASTARWHEARRWQQHTDTPSERARAAIRACDIEALSALLDAHPDVVVPSEVDVHFRQSLARIAVACEYTSRDPAAKAITELLAARGADVQRELDAELLGWWPMQEGGADRVRWMLDRGANPRWSPPNGISVLEHALVRFRDPECVNLIAAHVTPKPALWIAAGLGDVDMLRQFVAARGRLTPAGRRHRPDLIAMGVGFGAMVLRQDADDLEIMWEAFRIAGWNQRWHAMDALLEAGLPIDHDPIGFPLIAESALNMHRGWALAEYLVSRGVDLDRDCGPHVGGSVRVALPLLVESLADPHAPEVQRMLDLCGAGTVAGILAVRDARPRDPVTLWPRTDRVLRLAADDAATYGASSINTEHLLVGFLRVHDGGMAEVFAGRNVDMAALRARLAGRLRADADPLTGDGLPLDEPAASAVRLAAERAEALRRDGVSPGHLLIGILELQDAPGATLLRDVGVTSTTFGENHSDLG